MHELAPPESDLYLPLPAAGEQWDPHLIHTHYFGFQIPEHNIGAFLYARYHPAFPLSVGGVYVHRGLAHDHLMDCDFTDYEGRMPWPEIDGTTIRTANGLVIDFLEPGRKARITYESNDGRCSIDVVQEAISPLVARGHVMPGEEVDDIRAVTAGGSEQFMHCTGTLTLDGETFDVDCMPIRDRSWNQVRTERRNGVITPPIGWSPMCFGPDYGFNQVGYENLDTNPLWKQLGLFPDITEDQKTFHFAWVVVDGEVREVTSLHRHVLERHPVMHVALRQEIEAVDSAGQHHRFHGEALSATEIYSHPNQSSHDTMYRWETDTGRVAYGPQQEVWHDTYAQAVNRARIAGEVTS